MLSELLSRRALIVLGKGGVGKTTLSGALATLSARAGKRTLVMECDSRAPLAATFGVKPSFVPVEVAPHLALTVLDGRHALDEYLRLVLPGRVLLKAVFASRLYQFFVQAAPGLRELMMLGKVYYEVTTRAADPAHWELIIVDAPASGQALSLLKMPTAARGTFGDSIVGKESSNISRMLRNHRSCAIVQVTTSDGLSVSETIETHAELVRLHLEPAVIFFNRALPAEFHADDVALFAAHSVPRAKRRHFQHLADLARSELDRAAQSRRAIAKIRAAVSTPVIEIAESGGVSAMELIDTLAAALAQPPRAETGRRTTR